jgi:hypothetical protein
MWIEESGLRIILAAVEDRGLYRQEFADDAFGRLTSCLGRGSSMGWAISRTHQLRRGLKSRLEVSVDHAI